MAKESFNNGEIPVSSIIFDKEGNIISMAGNNRQNSFSVLGHAEIISILKAEEKIKDWRLDGFYMLSTLEPCDMCSMIINKCRIDKVFYILDSKCFGKYDDFGIVKEQVSVSPYIYDKFKKLLTDFFDNRR